MSRHKYSKEYLIKLLRDKAIELGRTPTGQDMKAPAAKTYAEYFGSWSDALKQSQLTPEIVKRKNQKDLAEQTKLSKKEEVNEQILAIKKELECLNGKLGKKEKLEYIIKLRNLGCIYREIGVIFGCSAERIRQIISHENMILEDAQNPKMTYKGARFESRKKQLLEEVRSLYSKEDDLLDIRGFRKFVSCIKYFGSWQNTLAEAGIPIKNIREKIVETKEIVFTDKMLNRYVDIARRLSSAHYGDRERAKVSLHIWMNEFDISNEQIILVENELKKRNGGVVFKVDEPYRLNEFDDIFNIYGRRY